MLTLLLVIGEKGVLKAVHDWITAPGDGTEDIPGTEGVKPESGNVQSSTLLVVPFYPDGFENVPFLDTRQAGNGYKGS